MYRQAMLHAEARIEEEYALAQTYDKRMQNAYDEALKDCGAELLFDESQVFSCRILALFSWRRLKLLFFHSWNILD